MDFEMVVPLLGCLKSIAFYNPSVYKEHMLSVVRFVIPKVLMYKDFEVFSL